MMLFDRGRIGNLFVKNRIVMDAINIQLGLPGDEAALGQRAIDFYVADLQPLLGEVHSPTMDDNVPPFGIDTDDGTGDGQRDFL